jgi:hypothetical protein
MYRRFRFTSIYLSKDCRINDRRFAPQRFQFRPRNWAVNPTKMTAIMEEAIELPEISPQASDEGFEEPLVVADGELVVADGVPGAVEVPPVAVGEPPVFVEDDGVVDAVVGVTTVVPVRDVEAVPVTMEVAGGLVDVPGAIVGAIRHWGLPELSREQILVKASNLVLGLKASDITQQRITHGRRNRHLDI